MCDSYAHIYYYSYHRALHYIMLLYLHMKFRMTAIFLLILDMKLNTKVVSCLQFP